LFDYTKLNVLIFKSIFCLNSFFLKKILLIRFINLYVNDTSKKYLQITHSTKRCSNFLEYAILSRQTVYRNF